MKKIHFFVTYLSNSYYFILRYSTEIEDGEVNPDDILFKIKAAIEEDVRHYHMGEVSYPYSIISICQLHL